MLPAQQAVPAVPQFSQVPTPRVTAQPSPALHVLFEQQDWPEPPHDWQTCAPSSFVTQAREAPHWLLPPPEQHAAFFVPQATQVPLAQRAPLAVQKAEPEPKPPSTVEPQHASPMPPQAAPVVALVHEPVVAEQVPLTPLALHACPAPTHRYTRPIPPSVDVGIQQPFALHTLPGQQGCPGCPQATLPELPLVPAVLLALPPPVLPPVAAVPPPVPPLPTTVPPDPPEVPPPPLTPDFELLHPNKHMATMPARTPGTMTPDFVFPKLRSVMTVSSSLGPLEVEHTHVPSVNHLPWPKSFPI